MGKGEFENRDRDELGVGDLPDDLGAERGRGEGFLSGLAAAEWDQIGRAHV